MKEYKPIACVLHEQYQFAVMRKYRLELDWEDGSGVRRREKLLPVDVVTRQGAEYLVVVTGPAERMQIRLDQIRQAFWADNGQRLEG